ncbi:MAG: ribonucleoside-diphosphate reductase, adenosylcobalamin-dependent, partial [Muribaculaceae bacterium]|nr:ribonucleoside-diphosphate reductase, adenosylcobalamin-dependent [Muribaculaceae bacterium]
IAKIKEDPEKDEVKYTELHLWEKIRDKTLLGRRTGCGTTGEGDRLAALGLRYGTPEAMAFSTEVHKQLALAYYSASVTAAEERGAFEIYDAEREKDNPFILRLKEADPDLYERMAKHGRRNIACLTIAPTGTTSLMTRTTSGLEPVFLPVYKRRRKIVPGDENVSVDFIDEVGEAYEEFLVYHPKFIEWMRINGMEPQKNMSQEEVDELVKKSPYFKATSNDIDWMEKVRMQGSVQKWVDHSISVTINLPSDVTEELVGELYMQAWKAGCKGCTVYRDGSRNNVLEAVKKKEDQKPHLIHMPDHVAKRPKELEADVVRFQNNKEKWIAFVGLVDGKPYEIFTGLADDEDGIFCPKSINHGKIIKETLPD